MALHEEIGKGAKSLAVPAVASVAGAGLGLVLTRKSVRNAMPDFGDVGNLADDLRAKLDTVIGKVSSSGDGGQSRSTSTRSTRSTRSIDSGELDRRLREREQRRKARRSRS